MEGKGAVWHLKGVHFLILLYFAIGYHIFLSRWCYLGFLLLQNKAGAGQSILICFSRSVQRVKN